MNGKISITTLFFGIYTFLVLLPYPFANSFFTISSTLFLVIGIAWLLKRKYRPNVLVFLFFAYYYILVLSSIINKIDTFTYGHVLEFARIVVYLAVFDSIVSRSENKALSVISKVLFLFVMMDFISLIVFPDGIFQDARIVNEWTTTVDGVWVFGRKNNRVIYYMLSILLQAWRYLNNLTQKNRIRLLALMVISIVATILEKSSNSLITVLVLCFGVMGVLYKNRYLHKINVRNILIAYAILVVLLVSGEAFFFKTIVENVFHKDMTFSGRADIWAKVLMLWGNKPILGWGILDSSYTASLLGNVFFTSAHNQWLNMLFQGGVVLFICGSILYLVIWKTIDKQKEARRYYLLEFAMLALFVYMLFEAQFNAVRINLYLMIIFSCARKYYIEQNDSTQQYV